MGNCKPLEANGSCMCLYMRVQYGIEWGACSIKMLHYVHLNGLQAAQGLILFHFHLSVIYEPVWTSSTYLLFVYRDSKEPI